MPGEIEVDVLWETFKESPWDCGTGLVWPIDFMPSGIFTPDADADEGYLLALEVHQATITHWVAQFKPYVGLGGTIPLTWAIEYDGDEVIDGMHRLTAAKVAGLKQLPVL
jgi:hypothetical protein